MIKHFFQRKLQDWITSLMNDIKYSGRNNPHFTKSPGNGRGGSARITPAKPKQRYYRKRKLHTSIFMNTDAGILN